MVESFRPENLREALTLRRDSKVIPFAGGTDLMVRKRSWSGTLPRFEYPALFISGINQIKEISSTEGILNIGAAVTLASLIQHDAVPVILKRAAFQMASPAIRNAGTIGGNICNASPAGDTIAPLYALGATVVLQNSLGQRELQINEFIKGPGRIDLKDDELLVAINIPIEDYNNVYYKKVGTRKADALSKLSFVGIARTVDEQLVDLRMAIGAVAPVVIRIRAAENMLKGRNVKEIPKLIPDIKNIFSDFIKPIDDQRSNAAYRKSVSLRLVEDFLKGMR